MNEFPDFKENPNFKPNWVRDAEANLRDYELEEQQRANEETEAKKSPYTRRGGFTQLNDAEIKNLRRLTLINPTATTIFLFLVEHMSRYNAVSCSHALLMKVTGKGRTTVSQAVSVLKNMNFIGIKKIGTAQVFHLNANVVWHNYGDKVKFAELMAPILLDPDENPDMTEDEINIEKGQVNIINQTPKTKKKPSRKSDQTELKL